MASHNDHNIDRDVVTGNAGDQTPSQATRSSTPSSTPRSTSSPISARDYESSALARSEVVIWSFEDSSFTYTTENQLRDCVTEGKKWTQGLTWTRPRISSNTFEVKIEVHVSYIDEDAPPVCFQKYTETLEIRMPYKLSFNRNLPKNLRKYEKIFISRETPELYW
ncbi:hypothetical protein ONS95_009998 [Cadophora gregata]|uniref:uncharacterized protein n=1 Tax=Cadophora gregata TaxID=51156 RepID=UPI0026DBE3AD|nr:uncharacterized protein ONS95_009998 [Cadophora gregata]KAK0121713.1 hypothetical protein ONS95_009998 [Cadophora gregata]KAK0127189.1 hypothetical protein ONS96_006741 [Cadophora gregata f. sp. sojae]